MKINWIVRIKNKAFWLAIIPAVLLLIQAVADVIGYQIDFGDISDKLIAVVNAVFMVLSTLGIVVDPTTAGISDSARALAYTTPNNNETVAPTP